MTFDKLCKDQFNFLFFRWGKLKIVEESKSYLIWGLLITWLVGMGRYWDNPRAHWWQHLGLGSLAYVFILSAIFWLLIKPLSPQNWTFRNILVFTVLCSAPALLYAIPVELYFDLPTASMMNVNFLLVVAAWRVALYYYFLHKVAVLHWWTRFIAWSLPLILIVLSLMVLNLEHVVFNIMAGVLEEDKTANDAAYSAIFTLSILSFYLSPIVGFSYVVIVIKKVADYFSGNRHGEDWQDCEEFKDQEANQCD